MVPEWIRHLAREWGHEMRKFEAKLGNVQGTLGRIRDEGPDGAAIRGYSDHLPDIDFPPEVTRFHRAWLDLDYQYNKIIVIDFKRRGKTEGKWKEMGLSKSQYYRVRAEALTKIGMDFHLYE